MMSVEPNTDPITPHDIKAATRGLMIRGMTEKALRYRISAHGKLDYLFASRVIVEACCRELVARGLPLKVGVSDDV